MANLVTQSLKILAKATKDVGKEYTSNLTSFVNDARDVKNTIMNAGTDAADTYAKLKRTNITKAIHDWFYQEETDADTALNNSSDEFDAGFSSDSSDKKLDGESTPKALTHESMVNISNKQTSAIIKVGRRQTEQSVANTAEIVSSLNSRSAEMLTAVNNINKTLVGISSRLDKIIELQAVPLTTQQQEIDKGGLYQDGKLSLMRIFEQSKNTVMNSGPMSYLTMGLDALKQGALGPSVLASMGIKAAAQKIQVNGKSFDDWGKAFNEMIGTATQTAMNEMINSNVFKRMFPGLTSFEGDKNYGTIVPNHYDNQRALFDGMTRMSIVNVIPEMLAKINQSISGQEYHLDSRGKWIAGPVKNDFNEVTRASFQSGGLNSTLSSKISNAGVQSIGKKIPSQDIKDASEALTMAIVMYLHEKGDRAFASSRIKTELSAQINNAVSVLTLLGRGDAEYWHKVCQAIVLQLSSGMMDSAGFVTNVNQSLQKMIKDATDFAQSGKANASQAGRLTFNMAANQFLATHGAPVPTGMSTATNNNGTLASSNGTILNPGEKLGKFSTGQYVSGIFYLLNRGINVRIDKKGKSYDPVSLAQVRPDATPYVSDDTFGKMVAQGLAGKPSKLDDVAEAAVKKQLLGEDGKGGGFISKLFDNPALLLNSVTNLLRGGAGGAAAGLKDKARNFLGEERYDAIANKLGGIKDNINDRLSHDQRFLDARDKAKEKWGELREGAADKLDQFGHSRLVNNAFYNADSLRLKAGQNLINNYTSDDANDMASLSFAKHYIEEGRFDDAMDVVNGIKDKALKQAFSSMINIHKKRADGSAAVANGGQADIGSVLMTRDPDKDDGKVTTDESQRSILGRILGFVGRIAKGVAKLAARGAIDLTMGLKSMAQGLLLGYKDTNPNTGETHYNKGLVRNLTTVPLGAMAKGIKNGVGAVATGIKNKLTNEEGESIISKGFNAVRGLLNKLLDGIGAFKDMVRDKIGGALDKLKGSKVGQAFSKAGQFLQNSKFVRGFTSGFKDAKAARDKLINKKKREEAVAENPLQAEQTDMIEGKKDSIFSKLLDKVTGIFTSVTHQEELAEDEAKNGNKDDSAGGGTGGSNIGDVLETNSGDPQPRNADGSSDSKGLLGSIGSIVGDIMGNFGKMLGGMTQALLGIGEMVISIVTSLESFSALKDMVQSILVDGLQPLNEAFDAIMEAIKPLVDTLKGMVETIAKVVVRIAKSLIDVVQPIIEAIMPIIQTVIDLLSPILKIIEVLMNVIMIPIKITLDIISPVIEGIGYTLQVVSGVLQIGLGAVMGLLGAVVSALGMILSFMPGSVGKKGDELKETGEGMLSMAKNMLKAGAEQIKQGIQGGIALIQRLLPGGEDGKKEEEDDNTKYDDKRKATLANDFASGNVPSTTINNSWSYTYGSGNTNTTMNQHSYGGYMNMAERGCGPVALADAYGRRTGANVNPATLAAAMSGAGTYDPRRGTSVSSMMSTGNALGMGMRLGGVTAASLAQASPTNPITVMGSGQGFGTRNGNNHYVNVLGSDSHGGTYVANPMTGRIDRQATSNIVLNSKLGLYGSGDEDLSEYGFSDDAMASLERLKNITSKLTSMFTGETEAQKKINDANAERKANEIKRTLGDDYEAIEQQVINELKSKYPDLDDAAIQAKLNSREGWKLIAQYGGASAVELYSTNADLMRTGTDDVLEGYNKVQDNISKWTTANQDSNNSTSITGATMTPFSPVNVTRPYLDKTSITLDDGTTLTIGDTLYGDPYWAGSYMTQDKSYRYWGSPVHDFFNSTLITDNYGPMRAYSDEGWFERYGGPQSEYGIGSSGDTHEAALIKFDLSGGQKRIGIPAITGGTITYITRGSDELGLGNSIKWRDSGGMYHWYMHLNDIPEKLQEGNDIAPGAIIGYVGSNTRTVPSSKGGYEGITTMNTGAIKDMKTPAMRYLVTSAGPQGNTGDPGYINPYTYWQFKARSDELFGDTEKEQIYNYLTGHFDFSPEAAAGIMGVLQNEGANHALKLEGIYGNDEASDQTALRHSKTYDTWDDYTRNILFPMYDRDGVDYSAPNYVSDGKYLPGIGIAQWTAGRARQLREYANANSTDWYDLQTQLNFIEDESIKQDVFARMVDELRGVSSPQQAADIWMTQYEAGGVGSDPWTTWLKGRDGTGAAIIARRNSADAIYKEAMTNFITKDHSSTSTGGSMSGKFIGSQTNPDAFKGNTSNLIKSAAEVFTAYYDKDGTYVLGGNKGDLKLANGTILHNFRPDCSGIMSAVLTNMGYDINGRSNGTGFDTGMLIHKTKNDLIYKDGQLSNDWAFLNYEPGKLQEGDIVVSEDHMGLYVNGPDNSAWGNYGFDGGATSGIANSARGGALYLAGDSSWSDSSNLAQTISGANGYPDTVETILRYMGGKDSSKSVRGGLSYAYGGNDVMKDFTKQSEGNIASLVSTLLNGTESKTSDAQRIWLNTQLTEEERRAFYQAYNSDYQAAIQAINDEKKKLSYGESESYLESLFNPNTGWDNWDIGARAIKNWFKNTFSKKGSGDTPSYNTWEDWLFNTNPSVETVVPPLDESKLTDDADDAFTAMKQFTNKYNIQSTDTRRTEFFERMSNMTFNVRAKRVEELLEIMISKMDGNGTTEPLPNLFDDDIPEAVTRLSMG